MNGTVEGLVERLRAHGANMNAEGLEGFAGACAEAADRIEQLEAQLVASREALTMTRDLIRVGGVTFRQMSEARARIDVALTIGEG